jgi:hypothetical protein
MGFEAGQILKIKPMPVKWHEPTSNNVYIEFEVFQDYFGYIWTEGSTVSFVDSGFLGKRELDISKGTDGHATYINRGFRDDLTLEDAENLQPLEKWHFGQDILDGTNIVISTGKPFSKSALEQAFGLLGTNRLRGIKADEVTSHITAVWNKQEHGFVHFNGKNIYEMNRNEPQPLGDRLQAMVSQVQAALPSFLKLTNEIAGVLSNANQLTFNAAQLTSNLNVVSRDARLAVTNLSVITEHLKNPDGSLGQWLIPTNLNQRIDGTLLAAGGTLTNLDTNLMTLNLTLANMGNITSNLNNQVQANTNILSNISSIVVHTDEFIQGLKRFWLFRSTFAPKKHATRTTQKTETLESPKNQ